MWTSVILLTAMDPWWLTPAEDLISSALENWCNFFHSCSKVSVFSWGSTWTIRSAGAEFALNLKSSSHRRMLGHVPSNFYWPTEIPPLVWLEDSWIFCFTQVGDRWLSEKAQTFLQVTEVRNWPGQDQISEWAWQKQKGWTENILPGIHQVSKICRKPFSICSNYWTYLETNQPTKHQIIAHLQLPKNHRAKLCLQFFKQFFFFLACKGSLVLAETNTLGPLKLNNERAGLALTHSLEKQRIRKIVKWGNLCGELSKLLHFCKSTSCAFTTLKWTHGRICS